VIATANTRDQGVNELSAALKRRFNYIHIPIVADQKTEIEIVQQRSAELLERYELPTKIAPPVIELLATVFREIRSGKPADGVSVKQPSTTLSGRLDRQGGPGRPGGAQGVRGAGGQEAGGQGQGVEGVSRHDYRDAQIGANRLVRVPCSRGSRSKRICWQWHRESMSAIGGSHALAMPPNVNLPRSGAARAWHPGG
jgi:hypothetical protein